MQLLYQIDLTGCEDRAGLLEHVADWEQVSGDERWPEAAVDLALAAWSGRARADKEIAELTPDWPTHRQPPVDRAIMRLGWHEMLTGHAPPSVAINEAVELAKHYCGEQSPAFINGVLDKLARRVGQGEGEAGEDTKSGDDAEAWLRDAVEGDPQQDAE